MNKTATSSSIAPSPHQLVPLIIPSTGQEILVRRYTVREEKILLSAQEGGTKKEMMLAVAQLVQNCVVSPEAFDATSLATFDLEYLFIKLFSISMNEIINVMYDEKYEYSIDLRDVVVRGLKEKKEDFHVVLEDGTTLLLRYPRAASVLFNVPETDDEAEITLWYAAACLEALIHPETSEVTEFVSLEQAYEYILDMTPRDFKKLSPFLNMPHVYYELEHVNQETGEKATIAFRSLESFFTF